MRLSPTRQSNAASPPARSSAPGHHHTKNKRNGERLERNLPNQLGKDIEWHVRLPGRINSLADVERIIQAALDSPESGDDDGLEAAHEAVRDSELDLTCAC